MKKNKFISKMRLTAVEGKGRISSVDPHVRKITSQTVHQNARFYLHGSLPILPITSQANGSSPCSPESLQIDGYVLLLSVPPLKQGNHSFNAL